MFSDTDFDANKEQMLENRVISFGTYIIKTKGIKDNYQMTSVSCPGSLWYWLEYEYGDMRISMQVIYSESDNTFHLKEGSFSQIPI